MRVLLLIIFLLLRYLSIAQVHNFRNYSIDDGLEQFQVTALEQDNYGNIWMGGVSTGLTKYDGIKFCNIVNKDNRIGVYDIKIDEANNVWIRDFNSVHKFDGDSFTEYKLDESRRLEVYMNYFLELEPGRMLCSSTDGGLYLLSDSVMRMDSLSGWFSDYVVSLVHNKESILAFTFENGIHEMKTSHLSDFRSIEYPEEWKNEKIFCAEMFNGTLYILTSESLYKAEYNGDSLTATSINEFENSKYFKLKAFGNSMIVYGLNNIIIMNSTGISEISNSVSFSGYQILCAIYDHQDNMWVGTNGGGIYMHTGNDFMRLTESEGLAGEMIYTFQKYDRQNYLFGTNRGLSKVTSTDTSVITDLIWDEDYVRTSTIDTDGIYWFGANSQLLLTNRSGDIIDEIFIDGKYFTSPLSMIPDRKSGVWVGTPSGVFHIRRNGNYTFYDEKDGLKNSAVSNTYYWDNERLLISTWGGLNILENDSIKDFNVIPELKDTAVYFVEKHQNDVWFILTDNGLAKYDLIKESLTFFNKDDGLPSNSCKSINFDDKGNVWVGTVKGLCRLSSNQSGKYDIKTFTSKDGFNGHRAVMYSTLKDDDGIWFGTVRGAYKVFPDKIKEADYSIPTYLNSVKLYYDSDSLSQYSDSVTTWYNLPLNLRLPYNQNHLTFGFTGVNFSDPEDVSYSYFMDGLDKEWSPKSKIGNATYTNIPPGKYTFYVRSYSANMTNKGNPVHFDFEIMAPFWLTAWFIGGTILFVLILLFVLNRFYIKRKLLYQARLEEIKREEADNIRKELAMDFHDELGNKLANISTFSSLLRDRVDSDRQTNFVVNTLSDSVNSLMIGTREFIWSINPKHDNLFEVLAYLKDFGEDLFKGSFILFDIKDDIDSSLKYIKLPTGWARQIVLIFKEAMTNTIKHSKASKVQFTFNSVNGSVIIQLFDNGTGIKSKGQLNSNGMNNMAERARRIKARLEIGNLETCGTKVSLKLNLPSNEVELLNVS